VTVGALFSEGATGGYVDSIRGLWAPRSKDAFLFLDSRYHIEDTGQTISSTGLAFRKLIPDREIIIGGNLFWDAVHSGAGNDFDQLGLGAEILTHWVDARLNYYLPENTRYEIGRHTSTRSHDELGAFGSARVVTTERLSYKEFERALEGLNAEIGFLVPGLDRFFDARIFVGYYRYENPFGGDFEGFNARLEARLLPGVIAGVEYWQDAELMGGNWTAEISVSVPFSIYNLVTGRNPFEGAGEMFKPGPRPFASRMSDMIERSHRIQTTTSGPVLTGVSSERKVTGAAAGGGGSGGRVLPGG
jgi:hypothetical protein